MEEIAAKGGQATAVAADFADPVPAASGHAGCLEQFGRLDVLINSASIFGTGTLASTSEADWDRHFAINLKAPAFLCREFAARHLRETQPASSTLPTGGACGHSLATSPTR